MFSIRRRALAVICLGAIWTASYMGPAAAKSFVIPHVLESNAMVTNNGQGHLVVSNIGSTGQDGVSFDISQTTGMGFTFAPGFGFHLPTDDGAALTIHLEADLDGDGEYEPLAVAYSLAATDTQVTMTCTWDPALSPGTTEITLRKGDRVALVGFGSFATIAPPSTGGNDIPILGVAIKEKGLGYGDRPPKKGKGNATTRLARPCPVTVGGVTVEADEITISRVAGPDIPRLGHLELLGANPGGTSLAEITIADDELEMFSFPNHGLGDSAFSPTLTTDGFQLLSISPIPGSPAAGVRFDSGPADSVNVSIEPLSDTVPVGAFLQGAALGTFNGHTDQALGIVRFTRTDSPGPQPLAITADFSSVQSQSQHLKLFNGGLMVAEFAGHTGPVGACSSWPIRIGKLGGRTECIFSNFAAGTSLLVDGAVYPCDEIFILTEGPDLPIVKLGFGVIVVGGADVELVVTGEDSEPIDYHNGLRHRRLGFSTWVEDPISGGVRIANIGSSGQDGVAVDVSDTSAFRRKWPPGTTVLRPDPPVFGAMRTVLTGIVDGVPDTPISVTSLNTFSDHLEMTCDFSGVGAATQTITLKRRGAIVFKGDFLNLTAVYWIPDSPPPPAGYSWGMTNISATCEKGIRDTMSTGRLSTGQWWGGTRVTIGGVSYEADEVSFTRTTGGLVTGLQTFSTFGDSDAGVTEIPILTESEEVFGFFNTGIGQAHLDAITGSDNQRRLPVTNLGSSGQDGVAFDFGFAESCDLSLDPIDPTLSGDGAYLEAGAFGTFDSGPEQDLGHVRFTQVGVPATAYAITADFSAVDSPTQHLKLFDDGVMVGEFTAHSGPVGASSNWPSLVGKLGGRTECVRIRFPKPNTVIVNGISHSCDEMFVLSEGPPGDILKTGFDVKGGGGLQAFTVAGETAEVVRHFYGLKHAKRSEAELTLNAIERKLSVSNIGSSGEDGVDIDFTGADSHKVTFSDLVLMPKPTGNPTLRTMWLGDLLTDEQVVVADVYQRVLTDHIELNADFTGVNAASQFITIYDGDQVVLEGEYPNNQTVSIVPIGPPPPLGMAINEKGLCGCPRSKKNSAARVAGCEICPAEDQLPNENTVTFEFESADEFGFSVGGTTVAGDTISFSRKTGYDLNFMNKFRMLLTNAPGGTLPQVDIADEAINVFDHFNTGLGEVHLVPTDTTGVRKLELHNLGSSGEDGVRFDIGQAETCDVTWEPIDLATSPVGSFIESQAFGSIGGVPDQSLGRLRYLFGLSGPSLIDLDVDFTDICDPCPQTTRIVILNQGQVVADIPGHPYAVGQSSSWPLRMGKLGGAVECYVGWHPPGTIFHIDNIDYPGDEIRVLYEGGGAPIDFKSAFKVVFRDISVMRITGESSTPLSRRPFGDFDDSGCTDILDFLFLLDMWQTEVDGKVVGLDDFLSLLDNWQLGPTCAP